MSITYPLTPPSTPVHTSLEIVSEDAISVSESPWTFKGQTQEHSGARWHLSVTFRLMTRVEAAPWIAFLLKLKGRLGTFTYGSYIERAPQGAAGGTPKVNGANQVGNTIITDGWPNSTAILKAGDFFQIGTALYKVLSDVSSNGSGQASIDVWPLLRTHADNADIVTSNPKGLWRRTDNSLGYVETPQKLYQVSLQAVEAL